MNAPREDGWEELRRAAKWLVDIHADDIAIPKGSALWEDLQSLKAALAAARGEPGLDVERLARAIPYMLHRRDESWESFATRTAEDIAANYARLATPTTPEPDPDLLCPDCVGTGYVRHSGDMHFHATPEPDQ